MPILEKWGVYIPGKIGGRFRDVQAWKEVRDNSDFCVSEADREIVCHRNHKELPGKAGTNTFLAQRSGW